MQYAAGVAAGVAQGSIWTPCTSYVMPYSDFGTSVQLSGCNGGRLLVVCGGADRECPVCGMQAYAGLVQSARNRSFAADSRVRRHQCGVGARCRADTALLWSVECRSRARRVPLRQSS
eukprot:1704152-Prymnesium_polylepis.1